MCYAQFVDAARRVKWTQAAAAHVFAILQQEQRPVLDSVLALQRNVLGENFMHLLLGEPAANVDELRDLRVSPQRDRQGKVLLTPHAEAQPPGVEKAG